jgi:hypothetical protein
MKDIHFKAFKRSNYSFIKKWILEKVNAPYDYKVTIRTKWDDYGRQSFDIHIINSTVYYHTQKFLFASIKQDKPIYIAKKYSAMVSSDDFLSLLLNVDRLRKISLI